MMDEAVVSNRAGIIACISAANSRAQKQQRKAERYSGVGEIGFRSPRAGGR